MIEQHCDVTQQDGYFKRKTENDLSSKWVVSSNEDM